MARIHVLLKKEELDGQRLPGKVVIVLDILFATSSIVAALAHGATEVVPALDGDAALQAATGRAMGSYVLSGELNAVTLQGFAHPMPMALLEQDLAGKTLIYSTTNGTVAVGKARGADHVYAAALLNGEAIVAQVEREHPGGTVLIVCSGSADNFNLEDFYGAGYLVSLFARQEGAHELTDAANAARLLHDHCEALECLSASRVGRMMLSRGLGHEVRFAAQKSRFAVVPRLFQDGSLRAGQT
jgi:2-phosphosulfolactate phosphatase